MAANASQSGSETAEIIESDIILSFSNGLAWLLRKPYSESRTRRLLSIPLGTKRIPLLETLGENIECWGTQFVAAGCPLKHKYYQMF
jgi:hypothetical protein